MFVQALTEYARTYLADELQAEAWEERRVSHLLEIDYDGCFVGIIEHMSEAVRGGKKVRVAQMLQVPRSPVSRIGGNQPLLAIDDVRYVLGVGTWTGENEFAKHEARNRAFVELINNAAQVTKDPCLEACSRFYQKPEEVQQACRALQDVNPHSLVALSVQGPVVIRPSVKNYWNKHYRRISNQDMEANESRECLVSGENGRVSSIHLKIKGVSNIGGLATGTSLMSFSRTAFCSYGWVRNENSPVAPEPALAYVIALNELLRPDGNHRKDIAGLGVVFWLKRAGDFPLFDYLDEASWDQVRRLNDIPGVEGEANTFYLLAVSGNGGRLRVHYWISESLPQIKRNLRDWFAGLRIQHIADSPRPVHLWRLLHVIHRNGVPPIHRVVELVRRAVEGEAQPLGNEILAAALAPLRYGAPVAPDRIGLVRLCINDLIHTRQQGEREMTEDLDPGQTHPAYLCGRLFFEYAGLEFATRNAEGKSGFNVSVVNRYYGVASTYPAVAFPRIEAFARLCMSQLQRKRPIHAVAIDRRLQDLHLLLEQASSHKFPSMLNLEDQGRFAIGYYHQRASSLITAINRKRAQLSRQDRGQSGLDIN